MKENFNMWSLEYSLWINWIDCKVIKKSGKKFKSGLYHGIVKGMTINPNSNKHAFIMDDDSIIDCYIVKKIE